MEQELPKEIILILSKLPANCRDTYVKLISFIIGSGAANDAVLKAPRDCRCELVEHLLECTNMASIESGKYNLELNAKARSRINSEDIRKLGDYVKEEWDFAFGII